MFVVDTNVLVYAADKQASAHSHCQALLNTWRHSASAWFSTWSIVYEFLRVSTHPRVFRIPWTVSEAWMFVRALLTSPGLGILTATDRHAVVAEEVMNELPTLNGNIMHDAHTAILMKEHGIRQIYTHDTDFHRFPFLEVIDPLTTASS